MLTLDQLLDAEFKTPPWKHQLNEFEGHAEDPARAFLWQMRSGKSKETCDQASHLYRRGLIDCLLIFAPNGVHENWVVRECPTHMWSCVPWRGIYWRTRVAGAKGGNRLSKAAKAAWETERAAWWASVHEALESPDLMVITFNSESVTRDDIRKLLALIVKRRKVMAVWDESTDYRTPGSKRTKMMRALARRVPFRRILDGTSAHNSPLHLFAQFELLEKGALGYTAANTYRDKKTRKTIKGFNQRYGKYKTEVLRNGRPIQRLVGHQHLDELKERVAKYASVVLREDCADLPPIQRRDRVFKFTPEQEQVYRDMVNHTMAEVDGVGIELNEQPNKILKLQQIASGFIIDMYGDVHDIPGGTPRLDALEEEAFLAPGKVIVWCAFHEDMDRVIKRLGALDVGDVIEYSGRVTSEAKLQARNRFQSDGAVKALVGHPRAGGRGIELSAASTIIWYSHSFDAIFREQANERATKMGGGNIQMVDIQGPGVDKYIINTVDRKVSVADDVAGRGLKAVLQEVAL